MIEGDPKSRIQRKEKITLNEQEDGKFKVRVKSEVSAIPFILRVLYPHITEKEFRRLVGTGRMFMDKSTFVCEECYLHISQTSLYSGINIKPIKEKGLIGIKSLDPKKI